MKLILIGANGKIGELVQKALGGAGHEIVKVGHKSGDFLVEIENRESVRKLYQAVGSFDAVAIAAAKSHLLRFRNSPLKSGSFRWEANSWSDQSGSGGDPVHQRKRILHFGFGHSQ